jgi:Asp-tRNA(Asn)/Glu-tRNA(Gln) amidotransferase A subunit family amidase
MSDPRTQVGPLARSVADVALVLGAIAGPDGCDGAAVPVAHGDPAAAGLRGVRVTQDASRRSRRIALNSPPSRIAMLAR